MINKNNLPKHIAVIMDGNGRWANKRGLPKIVGHTKGVDAVRVILRACGEIGIEYLTVYAFSTENWKRSKDEVGGLMKLLEIQLDKETAQLHKNNVRLNAIGRIWELPDAVRDKIYKGIELMKDNTGVVFTLALNYGGRAELVDAVREIIKESSPGSLRQEITEDEFSRHLYTKGMPDPDLLIRTSGEMRISNFLLWQVSYSEIYITDRLWPDFNRGDLEK
ncbi:MAG: isoprenyl transferase, partial [Candidatus Omnitrophota bacterium]